MNIYLQNPLNVECEYCGAKEEKYCFEGLDVKAGFHPGRVADINAIVNEGEYNERSKLSKLAHHFYQREAEPNYRNCLENSFKLLDSLTGDKIEILMVLIEEGFEGSNADLIEVIKLL